MDDWDKHIGKIWENLPDMCRTKDLIHAGIYKSEATACLARKSGKCPKWLRIPGNGICYPRSAVIDFLKSLHFSTTKKK